MSSLNLLERKIFESLFNMEGGYVLDFTNETFAQFFRQTCGKDIDSQTYDLNGTSKAKRLRRFLEIESDPIVGKVLSEILDMWEYSNLTRASEQQKDEYTKARNIIKRLLGKTSQEDASEEKFLKRDYSNISINKLSIDSDLIPILNSRIVEAENCLRSNSSLAVIFLCGSILEGILLGIALKDPQKFNQAENSPKDKSGTVKRFNCWSLSEFIDVAYNLGFLTPDIKKFSHALREFRNYIHPFKQKESNFSPDNHTAEICLQVLKAAIASINRERN